MPKKESAKNRWKMIFKVEIGAKKYILKVKIGAKNWRNYWKIRFLKLKFGQKWQKVGNFFFLIGKKLSFWAKKKSLIPKGITKKFDLLSQIGAKLAKKYAKLKNSQNWGQKKKKKIAQKLDF